LPKRKEGEKSGGGEPIKRHLKKLPQLTSLSRPGGAKGLLEFQNLSSSSGQSMKKGGKKKYRYVGGEGGRGGRRNEGLKGLQKKFVPARWEGGEKCIKRSSAQRPQTQEGKLASRSIQV